MITFYNMTDDDILETIEKKEIPEALLSKSKNLIAVLTQDWCPDWHALEKDFKDNVNYSDDVFICIGIYNTSAHVEKFMDFKENFWQNALIPYIRCYKDSKFIKDSNLMPFQRIVKAFN